MRSTSYNIGSAIVIVGCLAVHLISLIYGVSFPSWILWLVGLLAVCTWAYAGFVDERKKIYELNIRKLDLEIELLRQKLLRGEGRKR